LDGAKKYFAAAKYLLWQSCDKVAARLQQVKHKRVRAAETLQQYQ